MTSAVRFPPHCGFLIFSILIVRSIMRKYQWIATIALTILFSTNAFSSSSRWGADYFPNFKLTTHEGKEVRFFDDLVKDKIVVFNFIYTTCPDSCPLETAQLKKVQDILGDRLGKDVFFYSITVDPKTDTPAKLKKYREKFGAKWTFLTGKNEEIIEIRKKLGLYIEEIQDGSNNHNVSMIIGNQKTGRWMKRSPFENPYVLADQVGNWLTGWKAAPKGKGYETAPELRNITAGEQLFRTRCDICHTITGKELPNALGPDLLGVSKRREMSWLLNWLRAPDQMLTDKDPIAMALFKQYDSLAMPNMRLNRQEADDLVEYIQQETKRITEGPSEKIFSRKNMSVLGSVKTKPSADVVAVMNVWVREALPDSEANAGYMTLINVGSEEVTLIRIKSDSFNKVEVHEMAVVDGLMNMRELKTLTIPVNDQVKLAPGGKHLMMISPKKDLVQGDKVDLTLIFSSGESQTVSVEVKAQ